MFDYDYSAIHVSPTVFLQGHACLAQINDVTIIVSNVSKWTDQSVLEYLNSVSRICNGVSVPASAAIFLGEVFDAGQRKVAAEWVEQKGFENAKRITMISDSLLIRGALTAYSWLTKIEAKAFPMKDHRAMCDWITRGQIANAEEAHVALEACFKLLGKKLL